MEAVLGYVRTTEKHVVYDFWYIQEMMVSSFGLAVAKAAVWVYVSGEGSKVTS